MMTLWGPCGAAINRSGSQAKKPDRVKATDLLAIVFSDARCVKPHRCVADFLEWIVGREQDPIPEMELIKAWVRNEPEVVM
jgi:hypothetical protein